jgi:hypothetical protein
MRLSIKFDGRINENTTTQSSEPRNIPEKITSKLNSKGSG